jgi:hypothetical protein
MERELAAMKSKIDDNDYNDLITKVRRRSYFDLAMFILCGLAGTILHDWVMLLLAGYWSLLFVIKSIYVIILSKGSTP